MTDKGKIIPFPERQLPDPDPVFDMSIFRDEAHGWFAGIHSFTEERRTDEDLRQLADALDDLAMKMRIRAEEIQASIRGEVVATVHVYKDSTVKVRYDIEMFGHDNQRSWLRERFDDAKEAVPDTGSKPVS